MAGTARAAGTGIRERAGAMIGAGMLVLVSALPLRAEPVDDLLAAMRIPDMLSIMREEGIDYGSELGEDLFAAGTSDRWDSLLSEIYDVDKMHTLVRRDFSEAMEDTDLDPLIAFFSSDTGQRIVGLELGARRAMIDDDVEDAARESYRQMLSEAEPEPRLAQIDRFIGVNDLLEANVTGALNASFRFYRGLVDGGGFSMTESEIVSDVWAQEPETREDTEEWLHAFLLLAYRPLEDAVLDRYIDLSATPEGKTLNRALFAGFNAMYDEISYALGLAAAQQMQGQDL